jgi:predicted nucleic acid-binding protein
LVPYERIVCTFGYFRKRNVRIEVYGGPMTRYVIGPDVAVQLARDRTVISDGHRLLAPTLLRSQVLSRLYQAVRRDELTRKDAERQLDYLRALRIRLLGDRVLQRVAWTVADQLGWPDTLDAEYVALTQLQAEAFVTLDAELTRAVTGVVPIAPIQALS